MDGGRAKIGPWTLSGKTLDFLRVSHRPFRSAVAFGDEPRTPSLASSPAPGEVLSAGLVGDRVVTWNGAECLSAIRPRVNPHPQGVSPLGRPQALVFTRSPP